MKDMRSALDLTYTHLQTLEQEINQDLHQFQPEHFKQIGHRLSKDGNLLHQGLQEVREKTVRADADLNYQLLATIDRIRQAQAFWVVLGSLQGELQNALRRIEAAVQKWTSRVEKTEQHPM
jgi:hypothetical protein